MGNNSSGLTNQVQIKQPLSSPSEAKLQNSRLKSEFDYNLNNTMAEAAQPHMNDPYYWSWNSTKYSSSNSNSNSHSAVYKSKLFSYPDAPPPTHTSDLEKVYTPLAFDQYRAPNDRLVMTPFTFSRSQGRLLNFKQTHETTGGGENLDLMIPKPSPTNTPGSGSSDTNTNTNTNTIVPDDSQQDMLERGDPLPLSLQHWDEYDCRKIKIKRKADSEIPAWMPQVKRSAAHTNLTRGKKKVFSKSTLSGSTPSYVSLSLKTKSTKQSFGSKLRNTLRRYRFKFGSQSMTSSGDAGTTSSTAATSEGSKRGLGDDTRPRHPWTIDDIILPESYSNINIKDGPGLIALDKGKDSEGSGSDPLYKSPSNFSSKGTSSGGSSDSKEAPGGGKDEDGGEKNDDGKKKDDEKTTKKPSEPSQSQLDKAAPKSAAAKPKPKPKPPPPPPSRPRPPATSNTVKSTSRPGTKGGFFRGLFDKSPAPGKGKETRLKKGDGQRKRLPPPPVYIGNYGTGSAVKKCQNPADRLKNVDIVEELVYNCPDGCGCGVDCGGCGCCSSCCPDCDFYSCCNECGECMPVCQPCVSCCGPAQNPVKYCRRQRFNFDDGRNRDDCFDGPPFPWPGRRCCNDPFDETPVGKNPTCHDCSEECNNECHAEVMPSESGTYFYDADRRCFARVIEVKNPGTPQPEIMDEVIDEEPILTNIEPIIQPVVRPNPMFCPCGPMPCIGSLGQPLPGMKPPSPGKGRRGKGRKGGKSDAGGDNPYAAAYLSNAGLMGLCGANMTGLTNMGPYGAITMPQYQHGPPPMKPTLPTKPKGPDPPNLGCTPFPPQPPCQPVCGGPTCFPGYPSTNYPPYQPWCTGTGDFVGTGKSNKSTKGKSKGKSTKKKDKETVDG